MLPYFPPKPVSAKFNLTMLGYSSGRIPEEGEGPVGAKPKTIINIKPGKPKPRSVADIVRARQLERAVAEAKSIFTRPLTIDDFTVIRNLKDRTSGMVRIHKWRDMGIVEETGEFELTQPKEKGRGCRPQKRKFWYLTKLYHEAVPTSADSPDPATQTAES